MKVLVSWKTSTEVHMSKTKTILVQLILMWDIQLSWLYGLRPNTTVHWATVLPEGPEEIVSYTVDL